MKTTQENFGSTTCVEKIPTHILEKMRDNIIDAIEKHEEDLFLIEQELRGRRIEKSYEEYNPV